MGQTAEDFANALKGDTHIILPPEGQLAPGLAQRRPLQPEQPVLQTQPEIPQTAPQPAVMQQPQPVAGPVMQPAPMPVVQPQQVLQQPAMVTPPAQPQPQPQMATPMVMSQPSVAPPPLTMEDVAKIMGATTPVVQPPVTPNPVPPEHPEVKIVPGLGYAVQTGSHPNALQISEWAQQFFTLATKLHTEGVQIYVEAKK